MLVLVTSFVSFGVLTLLLLGGALLWLRNALLLTPVPLGPRSQRWLTGAAWTLLLSGLLGAVVGSLLIASVPLILVGAFLAWLILAWYRQGEQAALFWSLGMAMKHQASLAEEARQIASERHDRVGRRAAFLAERLEAGQSLRQILPSIVPRTDLDLRVLVQVGAEYQLLDQVLLDRDEVGAEIKQILTKAFESALYLLLVFMICGGVLYYINWRVLPDVLMMYREFNIRPSPVSQQLLDFGEVLSAQGLWLAVLLVVLGALVGLCCLVAAQQVQLLFLDWPLLSRWGMSLDRARVLDALALGARRQRTMIETCMVLASEYPKRFIRRKLLRAIDGMRAGQEWCASLHQTGLITVGQLGLLRAAERVGNLAWAMHEAASVTRRRYANRARLILELVTPLLVFLLGICVLGVALCLFDLLTQMIKGVAGS